MNTSNNLKIVNVVAAVIFRKLENGQKEVFATQRGYGQFKDGWEFPGGKIEKGESSEQALVREIKEELATEIVVGSKINTIEYDYSDFHLSMECFSCDIVSGSLVLLEHENSKWLNKDSIRSVAWLPADVTLIDTIEKML